MASVPVAERKGEKVVLDAIDDAFEEASNGGTESFIMISSEGIKCVNALSQVVDQGHDDVRTGPSLDRAGAVLSVVPSAPLAAPSRVAVVSTMCRRVQRVVKNHPIAEAPPTLTPGAPLSVDDAPPVC